MQNQEVKPSLLLTLHQGRDQQGYVRPLIEGKVRRLYMPSFLLGKGNRYEVHHCVS